MADYANVQDIILLGRALTQGESDKAEKLIEVACAKLRLISKKYGREIDKLVADDSDYALAVKEIVVKAVLRAIDMSADSSLPAVQSSQSALGYSMSMTYLNAGQSLYFLKNELKELGIIRQRVGALEVFCSENND